MIWQIEPILFIMALVAAVTALQVRNLLSAVAVLAAYSFFVALLYAQMGAGDVAFTEVSVGAGVSGVFFLVALYAMRTRSKD